MHSISSIKTRINRVGSTKKITQAMHLVSTIKVQGVRQRMEEALPYCRETTRALRGIVAALGAERAKSAYITPRPVKNTAVFVLAGDQGLCGGYNVNISRFAGDLIRQTGQDHVVAIGKKAKDYLRRRGVNPVHTFTGVSQDPSYDDAKDIAKLALAFYASLEVDEVYLVHTKFRSLLNCEPVATRLLPISLPVLDEQLPEDAVFSGEHMIEPDGERFIGPAVAQYMDAFFYGAMTEAALCEQSCRMLNMDSAVTNSEELIEKLTLYYNRARQGAITQELTEIVAGYNAL